MSKKYIHYGHKKFDRSLFTQPQNRRAFMKPIGGMWASPTDAPFGWKQWCEENHFRECSEDCSFAFTLTESANVCHIRSVSDARLLPQMSKDDLCLEWWVYPDFEELMRRGIDAVELHLSEDWKLYDTLYGWDCDSIVILNPEVIVGV